MIKEFHYMYSNIKSMIENVYEVRNKVKVTIWEGDHVAKDLVEISYYDSKPVCLRTPAIDL